MCKNLLQTLFLILSHYKIASVFEKINVLKVIRGMFGETSTHWLSITETILNP
ncbi:hypothetical protein GGR42_000740 [Saonia flava]|uniref:Uncharacterized protein n=1 Tax=Saonia flava TaxID=523696 RepID=A0A846QQ95_9FLAO|nr:hypothetical protein [Saonia flava]